MIYDLTEFVMETAGVSHVYAMQYANLVKFGVSNQLVSRYSTLYNEYIKSRQWILPDDLKNYSLKLIAYVPGDKDLEFSIHQQLSAHRVDIGWGREWFVMNPVTESLIVHFNWCRLRNVKNREVLMSWVGCK